MPIAKLYRAADMEKRNRVLFANVSFPRSMRSPALPDLLHHAPFITDLKLLLGEALRNLRIRNSNHGIGSDRF